MDEEYLSERQQMVEKQLMARGITHPRVLKAMLEVPRHLFVPSFLRSRAYYDGPLPIGYGQTISQPYIVALMAQLLEPDTKGKVLEIGTGSGYAAAILSLLFQEVYTVERIDALARDAASRLKRLGYHNVHVCTGDGTKGWAEHAPYDAILVSAAAPYVPAALKEQLKPGGRLVIPVGKKFYQSLIRLRLQEDGTFSDEDMGTVCFVPLIGEEGWRNE